MKGVRFFKSSIEYKDVEKIWRKAIQSSWLTTGPVTKQFETLLSGHFQTPNVLALSSCTHALHIALVLANIKKGQEVIIPSNTFIATLEVIHYVGAKPVLCDIELENFNMNPDEIEKKISSKTGAIIAVPFAGCPAGIAEISKICQKRKIPFILDNAHALESTIKNKPLNHFADFSCYSFYATKNLTTAEGGALVIRNKKHLERARRLILHGMDKRAWKRYENQGWRYDIAEIGFKYNMTDIHAAMGVTQFKKLGKNLQKRQQLVERYKKGLAGVSAITWQKLAIGSAFHLFVIVFTQQAAKRKALVSKALAEKNIGFSLHFIPLYRLTVVKKQFRMTPASFAQNEKYFEGCLTLPLYPALTFKEVDFIVKVIKDAI